MPDDEIQPPKQLPARKSGLIFRWRQLELSDLRLLVPAILALFLHGLFFIVVNVKPDQHKAMPRQHGSILWLNAQASEETADFLHSLSIFTRHSLPVSSRFDPLVSAWEREINSPISAGLAKTQFQLASWSEPLNGPLTFDKISRLELPAVSTPEVPQVMPRPAPTQIEAGFVEISPALQARLPASLPAIATNSESLIEQETRWMIRISKLGLVLEVISINSKETPKLLVDETETWLRDLKFRANWQAKEEFFPIILRWKAARQQ